VIRCCCLFPNTRIVLRSATAVPFLCRWACGVVVLLAASLPSFFWHRLLSHRCGQPSTAVSHRRSCCVERPKVVFFFWRCCCQHTSAPARSNRCCSKQMHVPSSTQTLFSCSWCRPSFGAHLLCPFAQVGFGFSSSESLCPLSFRA
jgi:hypothetical protein